MIGAVLRGLAIRRARSLLTAVAIMLGVAMVSVGAGFGVTLAAVTPAALRAMRVPPILAMRGPASRPGAAARLPAGRALLLGVGLAATVTAALAAGLPTTTRLVLVVVGGALALFAGVVSAGVRTGTVHTLGGTETMTGVVPADIARFWHFTWVDGSGPAGLTALGHRRTAVLLASDFASAHHLSLGSTLSAETTAGVTLHLTVTGIYRAPKLSPCWVR